MNQKGIIQILLVAVVFLAVGALGSFFYLKSNTNTSPQTTAANYPTQPLESSLPEMTPNPQLLKVISTAPKSASLFEKSIISSNYGCGAIEGLVRYQTPSTSQKLGDSMEIVNITFPDLPKTDLSTLQSYINNQYSPKSLEDVKFISLTFRNGCGGYYSLFVSDLGVIQYPGTQKAKALLTLQGNGINGSPTVLVLAQKENDLILLGGGINFPKAEEYFNFCEKNNEANMGKCYNQKMISDPNLSNLAKTKTQELLQIFAIN